MPRGSTAFGPACPVGTEGLAIGTVAGDICVAGGTALLIGLEIFGTSATTGGSGGAETCVGAGTLGETSTGLLDGGVRELCDRVGSASCCELAMPPLNGPEEKSPNWMCGIWLDLGGDAGGIWTEATGICTCVRGGSIGRLWPGEILGPCPMVVVAG